MKLFSKTADLGEMLTSLAASIDGLILISTCLYPDGGGTAYVVSIRQDGRTVQATRDTLYDAVKAVYAPGERKYCAACKLLVPIGRFSKDANATDGLNRRCKPCERQRVARWQRIARPPKSIPP